MTAEQTSPTRGHDGDGAQPDRHPFVSTAAARLRACNEFVEFGTGWTDDARVTAAATAGDSAVPEPAVSVTITAPVDDDSGGVAVAGCLRADQARELAALAETCAAADETRSEPETLVPSAAAVGRLDTDRADVTLVEDAAAEVGLLYSDSDDEPTLVINTRGSGAPEIDAGARLSPGELRALAEALRHEAEIVEEGGV